MLRKLGLFIAAFCLALGLGGGCEKETSTGSSEHTIIIDPGEPRTVNVVTDQSGTTQIGDHIFVRTVSSITGQPIVNMQVTASFADSLLLCISVDTSGSYMPTFCEIDYDSLGALGKIAATTEDELYIILKLIPFLGEAIGIVETGYHPPVMEAYSFDADDYCVAKAAFKNGFHTVINTMWEKATHSGVFDIPVKGGKRQIFLWSWRSGERQVLTEVLTNFAATNIGFDDGPIDAKKIRVYYIPIDQDTRVFTPYIQVVGECQSWSLGSLSIKSDPPGASIYIEGHDMGVKTPASIEHVGSARYEVRVENPPCTPAVDVVDVDPDSRTDLNFDLTCEGTLRVQTALIPLYAVSFTLSGPKGTTHHLEKTTPYAVPRLWAGRYTLTFHESIGWRAPEPLTIDIGAGETVVIEAAYERAPTVPEISVTCPPSAEVGVPVVFSAPIVRTDPISTIAQWEWDFGDGASASEQQPSHTFQSEGNWTVTVRARDSHGLWSGMASCVVNVQRLNQSPISSPVCPGAAVTGENVVLKNNAEDDTKVVKYRWVGDFGDFTTNTNTVEVAFQVNGSKMISMYAQDEEGIWGEPATCAIEVNPPPCIPDITLPCDLVFFDGQATDFCWQSTCPPDPMRKYRVRVNNVLWGEVDDNTRCAHLLILTPGSYQVCVEVLESGTVLVAKCCTVTAETACTQQRLTLQYPALVKVGQDITICADATCAGPGYDPVRYVFTMNGQPWHDSYQKCHTIVPSVPGKIHFCVELRDARGNDVLKCLDVNVVQDNQAPMADPGGPYSGYPGSNLTAHGSATDPDGDAITAWEWTFQGQKYTAQDAILTLPQTPGVYPLSLRVKDSKDLWSAAASASVTSLVANGTIEVTCNHDAGSWSISPEGYSGSGRYTGISDVPQGTYTITWYPVAGYDTPASQTQALAAGGSVSFNGSYSTTTTPVQISGQTSMTVTVGQDFRWEWAATGGTPAWGIWFSYGGLPSGVSGDSQGFIQGPCNIIGDYVFTVTAHDAASSANTTTVTCTLHVAALQGQLAVDRDYVDFGGDRTLEEVYVTNIGQGGGIQFTTQLDQTWLTVYPTIGTTNANLRLTVSRTGLNAGVYEGHVYLTSSGGNITINAKMSVGGTQCADVPDLLSPLNCEVVSISGFDWTWMKVCESVGEYTLWVVDGPSYDANPLLWRESTPRWTTESYYGDALKPNRTYYWFLLMGMDWSYPKTSIKCFRTVP